jgi:hypothetical protein
MDILNYMGHDLDTISIILARNLEVFAFERGQGRDIWTNRTFK